jgi:hypothetical protein
MSNTVLKKSILFTSFFGFQVWILSIIIGYSAVNSDLCKYTRVFEIVRENSGTFRYINSININFLLSTWSAMRFLDENTYVTLVQAFGIVSSILYIYSIYQLIKTEVNINSLNITDLTIISLFLILNVASTNIAGLVRSYWASLLLILFFGLKNFILRHLCLLLAFSLHPLTILPSVLIYYIWQIRNKRITFLRISKTKAYLSFTFSILGLFFAIYKFLFQEISYVMFMQFVIIFLSTFLTYRIYISSCKSKQPILGNSIISLIDSLIQFVFPYVLFLEIFDISPDSYRILFPISFLSAFLFSISLIKYFKLGVKIKKVLIYFFLILIPFLIVYYKNFDKVFAKTDDVLCILLRDDKIQIIE